MSGRHRHQLGTGRVGAPPGLPRATGQVIRVDIDAVDPPHPSWALPVHAYFTRTPEAWKLVGLERLP